MSKSLLVVALGGLVACGSDGADVPPDSGPDALPPLPSHPCESDCVDWGVGIGGNDWGAVHDVAIDGSGDVLVAGMHSEGTFRDREAYLAKFSSSGTETWSRQFGTDRNDEARAVAVTPSGEVIVGGYVDVAESVADPGSADAFVAKYSPSGTSLWMTEFGDPTPNASNQLRDGVVDVGVLDSGEIVAVGQFWNSMIVGGDALYSLGESDVFVVLLSSTGAIQWGTRLASMGYDHARRVTVTPDAFYVTFALGASAGFGAAGDVIVPGTQYPMAAVVARLTLDGQLDWVRTVTSSVDTFPGGTFVLPSGDIAFFGTVLTAYDPSYGQSVNGAFARRFSPAGDEIEDFQLDLSTLSAWQADGLYTAGGHYLFAGSYHHEGDTLYVSANLPERGERWRVEALDSGSQGDLYAVAEGPDGTLAVGGVFRGQLRVGDRTISATSNWGSGFVFVLRPGIDP